MLMKTEPTPVVVKPVGFHLVSSEIRDLTPEEVTKFRAIPSSMVEREITKSRIKHLREKINLGLGVTFHWVTAELNGNMLRGNGQHSSTMLAEFTDETFPRGLKICHEHYKCDTPDDFAVLFQQFDDRTSSRSTHDVAAVYQGFQSDLVDVPHKIAKLAIDGYVFYQRTIIGAMNIPVGDISYALFDDKGLHPFIKWVAQINNSKTMELQYQSVAAAMFGTYSVNESEAKRFWDEVSRGGDPDKDDSPERVLDLWLRSIREGEFEAPASIKWGPKCHYQGCIYGWNASRENRRITAIKYDVKKNVSSIRE